MWIILYVKEIKMKTKKILKVLKEIKENAPPKIDGIFDENFVKIIFYSDGSGHVELNDTTIFSFCENFDEFPENYLFWKNK